MDLVIISLSLTVKLLVSNSLQNTYIEKLLVQLKNCRQSAALLQHSINQLTADSDRSCYLNRRRNNKTCAIVKQETDNCNTFSNATNKVYPTDSKISNIAPMLVECNKKLLVGSEHLNAATDPNLVFELLLFNNLYLRTRTAATRYTDELHQKCKKFNPRKENLLLCFDNGG
ncbi:hypothetical protein XENTR_v10013705 [Xenopus tropicalis]|nr:hypothetical protein XENTR_v10013705 [Xenopus tropicalis]